MSVSFAVDILALSVGKTPDRESVWPQGGILRPLVSLLAHFAVRNRMSVALGVITR